jgi:hypothetical protein
VAEEDVEDMFDVVISWSVFSRSAAGHANNIDPRRASETHLS